MNKQISGLILILAISMAIPLQGYTATAKETVETGVNKVLKTLADPAFKAKPEDAKIEEVSNIIGEVFDFMELSKRTLGREWKKLNGEQKKFGFNFS